MSDRELDRSPCSADSDRLCIVAADLAVLRTAVQEACDLLAERAYGNGARSPGHNARLVLERGLKMAPEPSVKRIQDDAQAAADSGAYARMRARLVAIRNNPDCPAYIWTAIDSIIIDQEPRSFPASQPSPAATVETEVRGQAHRDAISPSGGKMFNAHNGCSAGNGDNPAADARWNEGCDFALEQVCKYLKVDPKNVTWDAATETIEGDMAAVINSIMDEADKVIFASQPQSGDHITNEPQAVAMRECLESIAGSSQEEPRQPDDADWRFRCLSMIEAAKNTLALSRPQGEPVVATCAGCRNTGRCLVQKRCEVAGAPLGTVRS